MFWEKFIELCVANNTKPNPVAKELGIASGTVTKWKNGANPSATTLKKIADYFGVTTDYFLVGEEEKATPDYSDVKVALFGGDGEVTDEMWDEVKQFADYVKAKYLKEKK